jgi:hypothetical protein
VPVTPIYGLPYPALTDSPNGPAQIGALAQTTETVLSTQITMLQSSIATLANPARAQMRQIAVQTLTTGVFTPITFTAEDHDSAGGHSNSVNTSRYTAQVAGLYEFGGGVAFAASGTGARICAWFKNGVQIDGSDVALATAGAGLATRIPARIIQVQLAVSDYVELAALQDSGASLDTFASGSVRSTMTVKIVRNDNF